MEEKKNKTRTTSKRSNLHLLHFSQKSSLAPKVEIEPQSPASSFDELAAKLDSRLNKIEADLKDSLNVLESDVKHLVKKSSSKVTEKEISQDLENLTQTLEIRIKKTLDHLIETAQKKSERENLSFLKNISSQIIKILSFDFYRAALDKNQETHAEENIEVDEFGMDPRLTNQIKPFFDFLYYKYWRVETTGIENIPNEGRALIVANHSGTLPYDGAMLKAAILNEHPVRQDVRFLVENFVYHMPILGTFMYRIGGVRACPENAERLLQTGHLVAVFPEGAKGIGKYYLQRYRLQRFGRGGFIKLCINTKSPLIPVGIVGAEEIHPILFKSNTLAKTMGIPYLPITPTFPFLGLMGMIPFPSKWSIHFGKPIHFDDYSAKALDDEILIHKLSEKVRGKIQHIIIDLLKNRKSVWTG